MTDPELRLLHIHAHPDDESSKGAATTAYYVAQGVRVMVVSCTGGERGDILNPALDTKENWDRLPELRREEMSAAADLLGIEHRWLGFMDSGLPEGDPLPPLPEGCFAVQPVEEAAGRLVKILREFRPHVVTTYDENGGYPHPDHIMCHKVSMAALEASADPQAWPEHGEPWRPSKVYYDQALHRARFVALDAAMHAQGLESPYQHWLDEWVEDPEASAKLTTFIPCGEFFDVRNAALLAHASQIDPDSFWFAVPTSVQREAWPTEDFQLVSATVPVTLPEDDLFAGLRSGGQ